VETRARQPGFMVSHIKPVSLMMFFAKYISLFATSATVKEEDKRKKKKKN